MPMDVDRTGHCACKERERNVVRNYDVVVNSAVPWRSGDLLIS
jgi:hypothetical protein